MAELRHFKIKQQGAWRIPLPLNPLVIRTFLTLIAALDRYQSELYPAESNHLLDLSALPDASLILIHSFSSFRPLAVEPSCSPMEPVR